MLLCMQLGLVVWTLVRFTQIEHWSPGIRFFGNDLIPADGLANRAVSGHKEGTWFHVTQIRKDGGIRVSQLDAGSPAEQAGLESGDLITSVSGIELRFRPAAWFQTRLQSNPGDSLDLVWLHDDEVNTGSLILKAVDDISYAFEVNQQQIVMSIGAVTWFKQGPILIFPIVLLCFGTWLGFRRPGNHIAFYCALLFLTKAIFFTFDLHPMVAGWPNWILSLSVFITTTASFLEFTLMYLILTVFPVETTIGSWLRRRTWYLLVPLFVWMTLRLIYFVSMTYGWSDESMVQFVVEVVEFVPETVLPILVISTAGSLLIAQHSVARRQQQTRLQFIKVGFVSAFILAPVWTVLQPGTLLNSSYLVPLQDSVTPVFVWLLDGIVHVGLLCALPVAFAYTILANRVFGLSFVIGKSLRYMINNHGVNLILSLGMLIILYETISFWSNGVNASDLLVASGTAGFILILVGGWSVAKDSIIRFVDRYLFRDELENRKRLFRLSRTLQHFQNRNALLGNTGRELLGVLDVSYVAIYLYDKHRESLSVSWYGINEVLEQGFTVDSSFFHGATEKIEKVLKTMSTERPVIEYGDLLTDTQKLKDLGLELIILLRGESGTQGCIALGAKVTEEPFSGEEKEQLLVLAAELELALKNIEMTTSLSLQAQRMKRLSRRLIDIQESERRQLARDLHDDTGQVLTALKINLELTRSELSGINDPACERLHDAISLTDETMDKLRTIAHGLRPPSLDTVGLNSALKELCKNFAHHTRISVDYSGVEVPNISNPIDICLYRILQEGLTNCAKHGQATRVEVKLERKEQAIQLSIIDNGRGFDPHMADSDRDEAGIGLIDMQERLESLKGRMNVYSQRGNGTRLAASIPLETP